MRHQVIDKELKDKALKNLLTRKTLWPVGRDGRSIAANGAQSCMQHQDIGCSVPSLWFFAAINA
jgi:hypothetical protein